jgi:hypothetical protein
MSKKLPEPNGGRFGGRWPIAEGESCGFSQNVKRGWRFFSRSWLHTIVTRERTV